MELARGYRCLASWPLILPFVRRKQLGESLWIGRDSKMPLDIMQSRSIRRKHAIKEVEPLDNLIENVSCRKVFSHLLS
jgi:hypothetical protein